MKKSLLVFFAALFAASLAQGQSRLVIKGSDTLGAKLVPQLAEAYKTSHPEVSFEIAAEGSTTGIAAIIDGTANIGMASRRAKPTEMSAAQARGVKMQPTIVAYDGIGVIVNANNGVTRLTRRQVEQIFAGDITDWSAVGGNPGRISIYTRNTASGTYSDFKALAMNNRDYASSSQKMAGNEQIAAEVAKNPSGIGYVGLGFINDKGIKVVAIDGATPTKESVVAHKYPYARPTFYYTNGEPTGEAARFIEFTLSAEGRAIVEQNGFVAPPH
jgi:phosphate transport system substrate-binding protein